MGVTSRFGFPRLVMAAGLSDLADGVLKTALPLVALSYTKSPALIAGLTLALTLPWLVVSLPAGALADRWDRRVTMLFANTVRAAAFGLVAIVVLAGQGSIWWLYAGAILVGVAEVFYDTSAQSILPQIVPRDRLHRANGQLFAVQTTMGQFGGPPLGGVVAAAGVALALGAPTGLWVLAVGALAALRGSFRVPRTASTSLRADVGEGLRFLWRRPVVRTLAIMVGLNNLWWTAATSVLVLWAVGSSSTLHLTEPQYGLLLTTMAAGSVAGALLADRVITRVGRTAALAAAVVTMSLGLATPLLVTRVWLVGVLFVVTGFGVSVWNVISVSLRQRLTPDRLLGRLNSAFRLLAWGTMPLGAALGGALGQVFGIRLVFAVGTVAILAALGFLSQLTPSRLAAAEMADESATSAADSSDASAGPVPDEV